MITVGAVAVEELADRGLIRIIESAERLAKFAESEAEIRIIRNSALGAMADFEKEGVITAGQYKAGAMRLKEVLNV